MHYKAGLIIVTYYCRASRWKIDTKFEEINDNLKKFSALQDTVVGLLSLSTPGQGAVPSLGAVRNS